MFLKLMDAHSPSHPVINTVLITLSLVSSPSYTALYKGNLGLLIVVLDRKHNSRSVFKGARQIIIFQICIFILCIIDLIM